MPRNAAKNGPRRKPPGGRRVSRAEVERRLEHADRMLRDGKTRAEIVASMVGSFGLSPRAVDSYIARARARWTAESKGTREVERAATLARLDRLSGKAENRGHFGAAVSAEKLRAQVTGLLAPQAVEVKATLMAASAQLDERMKPEDIDRELSEAAVFLAALLAGSGAEPSADVVENIRVLAQSVGLLPASVASVRPAGLLVNGTSVAEH